MTTRYYLGKVCGRGHRYQDSPYSLRKKSNRGCRTCDNAYVSAQMARAGHTPRPELPAHLALTAFLSPIICNDPMHRYRGMPEWTLRYQADETCVRCTTQLSARALTGD